VRAARDPSLPDLGGTVALVTGGSGGIGSGIALRFAAAGAAVVVHHRGGAERAEAVVAEIVAAGGQAVTAQADVTDPEACTELVDGAVTRFGRLDAVVAAAGVQPVAELAGMPVESWREVVDGNATAAFATVQAAAAVLRGRSGSITLIASVEGARPARGDAHCAAA
jgi:NAD(P)-dependent dehydrogenase (short-subunit alcohol dehydrogenase family)